VLGVEEELTEGSVGFVVGVDELESVVVDVLVADIEAVFVEELVLVDEEDAVLVPDHVADGLGEGRSQLDAERPLNCFPRSEVAKVRVRSTLVIVPPAVGIGIVNSMNWVGATPWNFTIGGLAPRKIPVGTGKEELNI
jgi:hypothetical protein